MIITRHEPTGYWSAFLAGLIAARGYAYRIEQVKKSKTNSVDVF
jgi:hypothetical protein